MRRVAKPGTSWEARLRRRVYRPEIEHLEYRFYPGTVMDLFGWSALGSGMALLAWDRLAGALDSLRDANRESRAFSPTSSFSAPTQNLEIAPARLSSDNSASSNRGSSQEANGYFHNQVGADGSNDASERFTSSLWSQTDVNPFDTASPESKRLTASSAEMSEPHWAAAADGMPADAGRVSSASSTPYRGPGYSDGAGSSYGPSLYFSPPSPNVPPADPPASNAPANPASAAASAAAHPAAGSSAGPLAPSATDVTTTYFTAVPCNYWYPTQPDGFQVVEAGGTDPGRGTVTQQAQGGCDYQFSAGNSHLVSLTRTFQISTGDPPGISLKGLPQFLDFNYADAALDGSVPARMKDAFEAALLDDQGRPLTNTIAPGRDAFFNLTAGQAPLVPREGGVTVTNQHVIVDIHNLVQNEPVPTVTLALRLIHNAGGPSSSSIRVIGQHPNSYRVPGNTGTSTQLTYTYQQPWGEAGNPRVDELGYYVVDDRDGTVNGIPPSPDFSPSLWRQGP
jgi:hypothetical protein